MTKGPYGVDLAKVTPSLHQGVTRAAWIGPREVSEAYSWPMLHIGGTHSGPTPDHILHAVAHAAARPPYPPTMGLLGLRAAIAERLSAELGYTLDPEREILVTCGSMHALYLALVVAAGDGKGVVAHAPSFLYSDLAAVCGARFRWAPHTGTEVDWATFTQNLTSGTGLAIVNTPCNPTGYVFTEKDLEELSRAVHGRDLWVLADEALMTYVYDGRRHVSPASLPELRARTVFVRSFSKMYSMGSWRVGFAAGPETIISAMAKALQWMVIGVDSVAQAAALAALTGPQDWVKAMVARLALTREQAVEAINQTGLLHAEIPQAGAVLWARLMQGSLDEQRASLVLGRQYGIPAVPGQLFGATEPHLRIPFGGERQDVELLLQRMPEIDLPEEMHQS